MIGSIPGKPASTLSFSGWKPFDGLFTERYQVVVLLIYIAVIAVGGFYHEPWMDEAQAWLLAKDASIKDIFFTYLKYEGTPGLWHLTLSIPAKLGLPYASLNIIAGLFSVAGVYVFVRFSPFSPAVKCLFPFTYFTLFQYGIIARSYCMIPLVIFSVAMVYHHRMNRPFLYMFLLFILANISAHTYLVAGGLVFLHFLNIVAQWPWLTNEIRKNHALAIGAYGLLAGFVAFTLIPPRDHMLAAGINSDFFHFIDVSVDMIMGSLTYNHLGYAPSIQLAVAAVVFLVTFFWLREKKMRSIYLFPLVLLCLLFSLKYKNLWHQGVLFYLWIFALWVSHSKHTMPVGLRLTKAVNAVMILVFAVHTYWGIASIVYDIQNKYSGSRELVKYIKQNGYEGKKIFASGWKSASILPYFDNNIFYNYNNGSSNRFWIWSNENTTPMGAGIRVMDSISINQPDLVILASHYIPSSKIISFEGYQVVDNFKGFLCWKGRRAEPECFLVFKKRVL
ncbi:hypothetical protein [Aridibaculum aurantiacum]|uniref:hypothetical protein n=1 Tax=Aridibaculum aurantiacum TaxID=2810307 RepID=UPI001A96297E|nr:hypothetical protein [Aridibaculum aurantiacum]